jgi:hypothetical protein
MEKMALGAEPFDGAIPSPRGWMGWEPIIGSKILERLRK